MLRVNQNPSRRSLAVAVPTVLGTATVPMAAAESTATLEEITVTATRREATVQAIPFNIAAVSGQALVTRGVAELVESHQLEIKTQRDFRSDRASIAVLPPIRVPSNRGKVNLLKNLSIFLNR